MIKKDFLIVMAYAILLSLVLAGFAAADESSSAGDTDADSTDKTSSGSIENTENSKIDASCVIDRSMAIRLNRMHAKLDKESARDNVEETGKLKEEIASLSQKIREQKMLCQSDETKPVTDEKERPTMQRRSEDKKERGSTGISGKTMPPNAVALGVVCQISEEKKEERNRLWDAYKEAIKNKEGDDDSVVREAKMMLTEFEEKVKQERKDCIETNSPSDGVQKRKTDICEAPQELYEKIAELKEKGGSEAEIKELDAKIMRKKAQCNALHVTDKIKEKDVADYYKEKLSNVMSSERPVEHKIESLRELRNEIDESIKRLIEEKKKVRFEDFGGVVEDVTVTSKEIQVGDASVESTGIEIETKIENSAVSVKPTLTGVVLTQEGLTVSAPQLSVTTEGLEFEGKQVKVAPKALFEKHMALKENRERIKELRLEKQGEKAVYKAEYESRKRLLGFIPMNAKESVKIDSADGKILEEKKPWWDAISSDVKEETTTG